MVWFASLLSYLAGIFRSRAYLELENLALRHLCLPQIPVACQNLVRLIAVELTAAPRVLPVTCQLLLRCSTLPGS